MSNRVTSEVWVSAFLRRANGKGEFCTILQKGAEAAGAIFICHRHITQNSLSLFGPAPQSLIVDEMRMDRQFERVLDGVSESKIDEYLERQKKFDPDIWVVEVESNHEYPDF